MLLRNKLIDRINALDTEKLMELSTQMGIRVQPEDVDLTPIWVSIKTDIPNIASDPYRMEYLRGSVQRLLGNIDKVKVILLDGWYVNKDLGIRLQPEWVEVISVSNEVK